MSYKIFNNFLEKEEFIAIKNVLMSDTFPWYFNDKKTADSASIYNFQFTHTFYKDYSPSSSFMHVLSPLIKKINPTSIVRIKANMDPIKTPKIVYDYHTDVFSDVKCTTAVFYVNNNNGCTVFSNGVEIKSVENTLVSFDSNILHAGTSCTDTQARCVINLNYIEKGR